MPLAAGVSGKSSKLQVSRGCVNVGTIGSGQGGNIPFSSSDHRTPDRDHDIV